MTLSSDRRPAPCAMIAVLAQVRLPDEPFDPAGHLARGAALDDLDHPARTARRDIGDRGAPPCLGAEPARAHEQGLVRAQRVDRPDSGGVGFQQRFAVGDDHVVDRVPVAAQLGREVGHGSPMPADLHGRRTCRACGHQHPWRGDPLVDIGPRPDRTQRLAATQTMLAYRQPCRPAEARQINEYHHRPFLDHGTNPAPGAPHRSSRASTCTTIGRPAISSTASTLTSGKPTSSSSNMRVGLTSTGAPSAAAHFAAKFWMLVDECLLHLKNDRSKRVRSTDILRAPIVVLL